MPSSALLDAEDIAGRRDPYRWMASQLHVVAGRALTAERSNPLELNPAPAVSTAPNEAGAGSVPHFSVVGVFLFSMFEGGGNVPLITPVVAAMVERGHDVAVIAGPNIRRPGVGLPSDRFLDRLAGTERGSSHCSTGRSIRSRGTSAKAAILGRSPSTLLGANDVGRTARWSPAWATGVAAEIERRRPHVLVCDFFLLGALAAGERADVRTAALVHNSSVNWPLPNLPLPPPGRLPMRGPIGRVRDRAWAATYDHVARREGLRFINDARSARGLRPLRRPHEQVERAARVLVMANRAFGFRCASRCPRTCATSARSRFVAGDERWRPTDDDERRPLVLVSLSTLPQGQGPAMQRVLDRCRRHAGSHRGDARTDACRRDVRDP